VEVNRAIGRVGFKVGGDAAEAQTRKTSQQCQLMSAQVMYFFLKVQDAAQTGGVGGNSRFRSRVSSHGEFRYKNF
jgi:hypothetical protein